MIEAPSNQWPVNQAALKWLLEAKDPPNEDRSYLAQLALWGLEKSGLDVHQRSVGQPDRDEMEQALWSVYGWKSEVASEWFLTNPNLERGEQEENLLWQLEQAKTAQDAAWVVIDAAYDVMVASSPY